MANETRGVKPIDVAIADKNPLVLSALSELIDRDGRFNLVLTVKSSDSFLHSIERARVQVGVIGWLLPPHGGGAILESLRDRPEMPRIVVYSGSIDPDMARKIMAYGAAGFCPKSEPPERLLDTIEAVAEGQMVFPYVDVRELHRDPWENLTPRERELLLRNLYDKLAIKNRAQAVAFYFSSRRPPGYDD
jgi:two-component system nitrate/nitrite response regulator NarP